MKTKFLQFLQDFVEGRTEPAVFQSEVTNNSDIAEFIDTCFMERLSFPKGYDFDLWKKKNLSFLQDYDYSLSIFIMCVEILTAKGRYSLHEQVKKILPEGSYIPTDKYEKEWICEASLENVLSYVDCPEITNRLKQELPDVSLAQKKKLLKDKMQSIFKCDNKPPQWLQNPEWVVIDGKPLVFRKQEKIKESNFIKVLYHFYDSDTKAEIIVEQYD